MMAPALALGFLLARLLGRLEWFVEIPLGIGLGIGVSSAIYFVMIWAGVAGRSPVVLTEEAVPLAVVGFLLYRAKRFAGATPRKDSRPRWIWALRIATIVAV